MCNMCNECGYKHDEPENSEMSTVYDSDTCTECGHDINKPDWWNIAKSYEGKSLCDDCDMVLQLKEEASE